MNPFVSLSAPFVVDSATGARLGAALALLSQARTTALLLGREVWEFAVEIEELRARGMTGTDLRHLVCAGFAEQAEERTRRAAGRRLFQATGNLAFCRRTCFVATAEGARQVREYPSGNGWVTADPGPSRSVVPCWDAQRRRLTWGGHLVKEFRLPAPHQQTILTVFQEEGWPARIDDPLRQSVEQDPKARLHDAVKRLNRHQVHRLLEFGGDGTGRGIIWRNRGV
jgi:hypothetical protein